MNNSKLSASYLIALYNKEDYIQDCLESIISDIDCDIDYEIIIVNDGSTDKSVEKVIESKIKYKNINIKLHSFFQNKGKVAAYNEAYKQSNGDFIFIIGADDMVVPGRTKYLIQESRNSNKSVNGTLITYIESTNKKIYNPAPKKISFEDNLINNILPGGSLVIRKIDAEQVFPIPEDLKFEDWWISFHLLMRNSTKIVDMPVTIYRIHKSNDNGVIRSTAESIKKDYLRHFLYLDKFDKLIDSKHKFLIKRSMALRNSALYRTGFKNLFSPPFDSTWIKLFLFLTLGINQLYKIKNLIYRK